MPDFSLIKLTKKQGLTENQPFYIMFNNFFIKKVLNSQKIFVFYYANYNRS